MCNNNQIRQKLWCDAYLIIVEKGGINEALEHADNLLKEFDKRFCQIDYQIQGSEPIKQTDRPKLRDTTTYLQHRN